MPTWKEREAGKQAYIKWLKSGPKQNSEFLDGFLAGLEWVKAHPDNGDTYSASPPLPVGLEVSDKSIPAFQKP